MQFQPNSERSSEAQKAARVRNLAPAKGFLESKVESTSKTIMFGGCASLSLSSPRPTNWAQVMCTCHKSLVDASATTSLEPVPERRVRAGPRPIRQADDERGRASSHEGDFRGKGIIEVLKQRKDKMVATPMVGVATSASTSGGGHAT